MASLRVHPLILLAFALAASACGDGSDDRAEVVVVAGARDEQPGNATTPAGEAGAEQGPRALLPDLVVRQPGDLWIQEGDDGLREIRFSTAVANLGEGPLEMHGRYEEGGGTLASQRILNVDGSTTDREVRRFVFHPDHEHWHFEDFTVFELWSVDGDDRLVDLVATTGSSRSVLWMLPVEDAPPDGVAMASILGATPVCRAFPPAGRRPTRRTSGPGARHPGGSRRRLRDRTIVDPDNRGPSRRLEQRERGAGAITGFEIVISEEL
jgi:hypothetical protein